MSRVVLKHKYLAVVSVVMAFMVFSMPILAQQEEFTAGRLAGEQAARANTSGNLWLIVGCLGGIIGIAVAYVVEPNPPAIMLLGKSPEYIAAYTDAYKVTAKSIQTSKAWTGCIVATIAQVLLYAAAVAATEAANEDF